jgi:hypothetical protein
MKKNIYILLVISIVANIGIGHSETIYTMRERPDHLMIHFTPTVSILNYRSIDSKSTIAGNMGIGMEYAHYFGQHWGLSAGAELTSFNSFYSFKGRRDSLEMFDNWSGRYYTLRQNLTTKEYQHVTYLSFPVKIQYRCLVNSWLTFNASVGAAYSLYLSENRSIISGTIDRRAFFNGIFVEVDDFHPLMFGKFKDYINPSREKQFKNTVIGIAEAGISFHLVGNWNMHTVLNLQYGFQNIKNRNINLLVPEEYAGVTATNYIDNIKPLSLGIRVGFAYIFDLFGVDCKCHNGWNM